MPAVRRGFPGRLPSGMRQQRRHEAVGCPAVSFRAGVPEVDQSVIAIGDPLWSENAVTAGVSSALARSRMPAGGGSGLVGLKDRVDPLGGRVSRYSPLGIGTTEPPRDSWRL